MCAIVDADVADQVFGQGDRPEAGREFFEWLNTGRGRMVTGGENLRELSRTSAEKWMQGAIAAGRVQILEKTKIDDKASDLEIACVSNDPHVVALAQISGARLLYSNDRCLHQDFRNKALVDQPRGSIYSTNKSDTFDRRLRVLLNKSLCRSASS